MSILIQNGTLLLPEGPARADLRLEGDKIAQIGPGLPVEDSRVVDASGRLVFPGFIDTHTHFEMNKGTDRETADDWATGTRAALAGGTTCVLDFAEPKRGAALSSALETWHSRADGRAWGQACYVETCPQYLLLDEGRYALPGFESAKFVLSPPLRAPEDVRALWDALAAGEIDTVGTDHCSFDFYGPKQLGREDFAKIPNGIPGVEHRPVLLYTAGVAAGRMSAHQLMQVLSERPAKLFGMYPRKGALAVGSDGDLVILDPNATQRISARTQYQNVDYTPYEGMQASCRVEHVFLSGVEAVQNGNVLSPPRGHYVRRGPSQFWR